MNEIFKKLNIIKAEILREKKSLRLFALVSRADLENKWDILFSADWLEKNNSEKDLIYLIEKLKSYFENLDFLARIVMVTPREVFIRQLAQSIIKEKIEFEGKINEIRTSPDFLLKILVIFFDFSGIDTAEIGTEKGPLAIKENSEF